MVFVSRRKLIRRGASEYFHQNTMRVRPLIDRLYGREREKERHLI